MSQLHITPTTASRGSLELPSRGLKSLEFRSFVEERRIAREPVILAFLGQNTSLNNVLEYIDESPSSEQIYAGQIDGQLCLAFGEHTVKEVNTYCDEFVARTDVPVESIVADPHRFFVKKTPTWKRVFDVMVGATLFAFSLPFMALAVILIKMETRGPATFRQVRVGHGGKPFTIYKLRTMVVEADRQKESLLHLNEQTGSAFKIKHDPRVTRIGRLLRKTSIDELPQLVNVIRGEMSIVGPRPLPLNDWEPECGWYCKRNDVLPGITCTWQAGGRSNVTFDAWMGMDADYVDSISPWTDLKILVKTVPAVLFQRGAS